MYIKYLLSYIVSIHFLAQYYNGNEDKLGLNIICYLSRVCHAFLSVHCSLVATCWERANLQDVSCFFLTFLCGVPGQI